jgi:hypothetical protein
MQAFFLGSTLFLLSWLVVLWLPSGDKKINKWYRRKFKDYKILLLRTAILLLCIGVTGIFLFANFIKNEAETRRAADVKTLKFLEVDQLKIDSIKFAHYYKLSSDSKYASTLEYNKTEKQIEEYAKEKWTDLQEAEKLREEAEKTFNKRLLVSSLFTLLFATLTLSIAGGFMSRSFGDEIKRLKEEDERC